MIEEFEDSGSVISEATWVALLERDDFRCLNCNSEENLQPAHYKSRGSGGCVEELENLLLLCAECHRKHHTGALVVKRIEGRFYFKERRPPTGR